MGITYTSFFTSPLDGGSVLAVTHPSWYFAHGYLTLAYVAPTLGPSSMVYSPTVAEAHVVCGGMISLTQHVDASQALMYVHQ